MYQAGCRVLQVTSGPFEEFTVALADLFDCQQFAALLICPASNDESIGGMRFFQTKSDPAAFGDVSIGVASTSLVDQPPSHHRHEGFGLKAIGSFDLQYCHAVMVAFVTGFTQGN